MMKRRKQTQVEIEARNLTAIWNTPLESRVKANAAPPPLLTNVPWFDSADVVTPGHSPTCGCSECFAAFCFQQAAEGKDQWA